MSFRRVSPLAPDYVRVFESPDPQRVYGYSPGICRLPNGRLVATCDFGGPGAKDLPGAKTDTGDYGAPNQGRVATSDDGGRTWTERARIPLMHATPFVAGNAVYIIGHGRDLGIVRSDDWGSTWGERVKFTEGEIWHQAPSNVWYTRGRVYVIMERYIQFAWAHCAPVVMSAPVGADLTRKESWTFSNQSTFRELVGERVPLLGVPFFTPGQTAPDNPGDRRHMAPLGWLETHIVQFTDPDHVWYDPTGRTFHLIGRAHTGTTNLACLAKAVEGEDGSLTVSLEQAPSGEPIAYLPCPGGHMKFHVLYDGETRLFWLLSTQATDSMVRPERLPPNRFNLPNNERRRLQLHFSRNCVDWCFAGLVAVGETERSSRHYASMAIDGEDLVVLSRSGDRNAKDAHNGNIITFHRIPRFRELVY
jgi:hypothetical protein